MTEDKASLDVYQSAAEMLDFWVAVAWSKLGLQPDIMSGKIETDLAQAKVAINISSNLVETIEGQLDDEDRRRTQGLVRDLKINYVQRSREGT